MVHSLSDDLRCRVVAAVDKRTSCRAAAIRLVGSATHRSRDWIDPAAESSSIDRENPKAPAGRGLGYEGAD